MDKTQKTVSQENAINDVSNLFKQIAVIVAIDPPPSLVVAQLRGAFGDNDMKVIRAFEDAIKTLPEIQALFIKGMTEATEDVKRG